jgi:hypothetical protein
MKYVKRCNAAQWAFCQLQHEAFARIVVFVVNAIAVCVTSSQWENRHWQSLGTKPEVTDQS